MYNMYSWDQAARATDEHADTEAAQAQTQTRTATRNGQAHHPAASNGQASNGQPRRASTGSGQARSAHNGQAVPRRASAATRHAQAVQFSLDRRDNGGDAGRTH